jgi:hypothetical protein
LFNGSQTLADNSSSINAYLDGCVPELDLDTNSNYEFDKSNLKNGVLVTSNLINLLDNIEGSTMESKLKNVIQEQIDLLSENEQLRVQLNEIKEFNLKTEESFNSDVLKDGEELKIMESESKL